MCSRFTCLTCSVRRTGVPLELFVASLYPVRHVVACLIGIDEWILELRPKLNQLFDSKWTFVHNLKKFPQGVLGKPRGWGDRICINQERKCFPSAFRSCSCCIIKTGASYFWNSAGHRCTLGRPDQVRITHRNHMIKTDPLTFCRKRQATTFTTGETVHVQRCRAVCSRHGVPVRGSLETWEPSENTMSCA